VILEFNKRFFDRIDGIGSGLTTRFVPPPCGRELDPRPVAKITKRDVQMVEAFHDRFIKEFAVMGISEQWAGSLHLLTFLAYTQFLWLTYPSGWFYSNCIDAISQQEQNKCEPSKK